MNFLPNNTSVRTRIPDLLKVGFKAVRESEDLDAVTQCIIKFKTKTGVFNMWPP